MSLAAFWNQPNRRYRDFQLVMTAITLNFAIPSISYVLAPEIASSSVLRVGVLLGGDPGSFPLATEDASWLWRMLGASNVMTLALMCGLLQVNLRKYIVVLFPLSFLKLTSATLFLLAFARTGFPGFVAISALDYATCAAFVWSSRRAFAEIRERPDDELVPRPRSG